MISASQKMTRSFCWLNAAQFGGALNDNVFKLLVIFFLITAKGPGSAAMTNAVVGAIFVLPFLLFTPMAGVLADRYSKRHITVAVKLIECVAMLLAIWAFYKEMEGLAYVVVFLMSTQSALFGPSKYGILPELVGSQRLSRANSLLVLFTYLAIILGTALAPTMDKLLGGHYVAAASVCLVIALLGLGAAWQVEVTPAMGSSRRIRLIFFGDLYRTLKGIRSDSLLFFSVLAAAYFLLLGGFVQLNLIPYGIEMLGISQQDSAYLFLLAALGIGGGAWLVGRLSGEHIELGWAPLGAMGVALGAVGLAFAHHHLPAVWAFTLLFGVSAGFFIVPLESFVQHRSPDTRRGEILAAKGVLAWVGVLAAAGFLYVFAEVAHLSPAQGFGLFGLLTILLTGVALYSVPDLFARFMVTMRRLWRR